MIPAQARPQPTAWSADDPSQPLRTALGDWLVLTIREADGDLPSLGEVALAEAAVSAAWRRLGEALASATYKDEVRTIHRMSGICFCCGRKRKLHMGWQGQ